MIVQLILVASILVLTLAYFKGRYNEYYWKRRGVPFYKEHKLMGPTWKFITTKKAFFECYVDVYKEFPDAPAVGLGGVFSPILYIKDPKNMQHIMQTDFAAFNHRAVEITEVDKLADNLLLQHGNRWKVTRQHMTPLFTATRLKSMYYILDKSARDFVEHLQQDPRRLKGNVFETLSTFSSAAIAAAVFGISTHSVFDSPFLNMAREVLAPTFLRNMRLVLLNVSMAASKKLGITLFKEQEKFFIGAIKQVIRAREQDNLKKHDFADLCVSLQKNGPLIDPDTGMSVQPTDEYLAAQGFFYFIAGIEPSATAMFGTLIELGRHPEVLEKVLKEVDIVFEKYKGEITYDAVSEMEYLDKVLSEAMRLHPPIGFNQRLCVRDSVLPVGNIKVDKGTVIIIPTFELHHDSKYYPNPEVFNPERFEGDAKLGDYSYQPFGKGNRLCIGMRYVRLQMKAGIMHLLRKYTVKTTVGDKGQLKYSKMPFQVRPANAQVEFIPRVK